MNKMKNKKFFVLCSPMLCNNNNSDKENPVAWTETRNRVGKKNDTTHDNILSICAPILNLGPLCHRPFQR